MKKILIIEDEPAYSKLLHDQLTAKGYKTIGAVDGEKGLELAKKERPDLILLDIRMPKMDGMAMLAMLRKNDVGKKIKVIVLTNLEPDDKIISQVIKTEPTSYCVKSDTKLEQLIATIEEKLSLD